jgi:hypothetical protein
MQSQDLLGIPNHVYQEYLLQLDSIQDEKLLYQ